MSTITKAICDNCGKELNIKEWFFKCSLSEKSMDTDKGTLILYGDYCKECFNKKIKEIIRLEEE